MPIHLLKFIGIAETSIILISMDSQPKLLKDITDIPPILVNWYVDVSFCNDTLQKIGMIK